MKEILTRERAIEEHRKMWRWIAEQYRGGSEEDYWRLKRQYTRNLGIEIMNACFCCEYDQQENETDCEQCPIDFGKGKYSCEKNRNSPYSKLTRCNVYASNMMNSDYMADLALEIANLPERKRNE